jgi:hypothetical protein
LVSRGPPFIDGEGCFFVGVAKNDSMLTGVAIRLNIELVQHTRDIKVLEKYWSF